MTGHVCELVMIPCWLVSHGEGCDRPWQVVGSVGRLVTMNQPSGQLAAVSHDPWSIGHILAVGHDADAVVVGCYHDDQPLSGARQMRPCACGWLQLGPVHSKFQTARAYTFCAAGIRVHTF